MSRVVRAKFWLFDHHWWLVSSTILCTLAIFLMNEEPIGTAATVLGALLSVAYFLQKQKLEEMRLFREIFKECNARYDRLNERLAAIGAKPSEELSRGEEELVIDYLNLCGEEYLYFRSGYIEPSVWQAWHNGMKAVLEAPSIRAIWEAERGSGSYYDLPL